MGFDKARMKFGLLLSSSELAPTIDRALEKLAYSETPVTLDSSVSDITTGISLADETAEMEEGFLSLGGLTFAALRTRKKKINQKLFKERLEKALHKAVSRNEGRPLKRADKAVIREAVLDTMKDDYRLEYSGVRFVITADRRHILVGVTNANKLLEFADELQCLLANEEESVELTPVDPELLLYKKTGTLSTAYDPINLVPGHTDGTVGADFLTWLWMASSQGDLPAGFEAAVIGNIVLEVKEDVLGAQVVKLMKGMPSLAKERVASLNEGKKVIQAQLAIGRNGQAYEFTLDSNFMVSGLKDANLKTNKLDVNSAFEQRISSAMMFEDTLQALFMHFIDAKNDTEAIEIMANSWLTV